MDILKKPNNFIHIEGSRGEGMAAQRKLNGPYDDRVLPNVWAIHPISRGGQN
ncbi:MAG: hypothetical protein KKH04_01850 [Proteobacteria bacterium]|nr:hypothetical protein [Pseudomonadota bacterium]